MVLVIFFFFKQKTAYEMRISDWSSDVCSSDLIRQQGGNAETHACDVTEPFAFEQLKAQALVRFGAVHIIMNNIATVSCGLPEDIPVEEWQRAFDVNLMSIVRSNHVFQIGRASCREGVCQYV